jgi:hypothetical protein
MLSSTCSATLSCETPMSRIPIDRAAVGDRENPGASLTLVRSEPAGGLPDLQEHLLEHLLALRAVDQHAKDESEDASGQQVVEFGECPLVSARDADQKIGGEISRRAVFRHVHAVDDHLHKHAVSIPFIPTTHRSTAHPNVNE